MRKINFKRIVYAAISIVLFFYMFSEPVLIWDEEVKLNDGRVIIVTEKKRCQGGYFLNRQNLPQCRTREFWLSFNLPEFSSQMIKWHENLEPLILNVDKGRLYMVGTPLTDVEFEQYGKKDFYIGYVCNTNKWDRIALDQIPVAIYDSNLLLKEFPPKGFVRIAYDFHPLWEAPFTIYMPYLSKKVLTLEEKKSQLLDGDINLWSPYKRVNPNYKSNLS